MQQPGPKSKSLTTWKPSIMVPYQSEPQPRTSMSFSTLDPAISGCHPNSAAHLPASVIINTTKLRVLLINKITPTSPSSTVQEVSRDIFPTTQSPGLAPRSRTSNSVNQSKKSESALLPPNSMVFWEWPGLPFLFMKSPQFSKLDFHRVFGRATPSPFSLQTSLMKLEALWFSAVLIHSMLLLHSDTIP